MNKQLNMQRSRIKTWIGAIGCVLAIVISFAIGDSLGQRSMLAVARVDLNSVQAMLAFNRLQDERELQLMLSKGCVAQVQSLLSYDEDQDMQLLAGFVKGKLNPEDVKYIADRDPKLLSSLSTFKSKYGSRWEIPECK